MIGIDIIKNERMEKHLDNDTMINKILSYEERSIYQKISNHKRKIEYLSRCFCAKEAFYKATSGQNKQAFNQISVLNKDSGAPYFQVGSEELPDVFLSITHETEFTIVVVIIKKYLSV